MSAQFPEDVRAATDLLIAHLRETVAEMHAHEHPKSGGDLFCLNLTSYMGDRMGSVLQRLADERAETRSWKDRHTALADEFTAEVDRLRAEMASKENEGYVNGLAAAARWAAAFDQDLPKFDRATCQQMTKGLAAMVESAQARLGVQANTQEPCDICSGYGCPDCRDDLSGLTR